MLANESSIRQLSLLHQEIASSNLSIMDEASQIRPEEALGAIARARQIVVVGDSQQMPPTRLLETVDDDDKSGTESGLRSRRVNSATGKKLFSSRTLEMALS